MNASVEITSGVSNMAPTTCPEGLLGRIFGTFGLAF
jgi:hypothetical protein